MALRLRGATSGYTELKAPASAGDNTLTLPVNNGSANQLLKTDGNGNLSWVDDNSGVSLSGSTNNTIATVTGANALTGEANLTFDGNNLAQTITSSGGYTLTSSGNHAIRINGNSDRSSENGTLLALRAQWDGTQVSMIDFQAGNDTTNKDNSKIAFYTAASGTQAQRMLINYDGKVGIGTSSPTEILHINSGSSNGCLMLESTDSQADLYIKDNSGWGIISANGDNLLFQNTSSQTERMRIDASGRLGIGTTSPSQLLEVNGTIKATPAKNGNNDGFEIVPTGGTTASSFKVMGNNNAGADGRNGCATWIDANYYADTSTIFNVRGRGTDRFRIEGGGNIAVGASAPDFTGFGSNGGGIELDDVNTGFTTIKLSHGSADMYLASVGSAGYISTRTNHEIIIEKNSSEVARFTDNGLKVPSGKGIDFSSTSDSGGMTSELLDDYEQGTFTPIFDYDTGASGIAHSQQQGQYTKIGNTCWFQLRIGLSNSGSGTNNAIVRGLPFTPNTTNCQHTMQTVHPTSGINLNGSEYMIFCQIQSNHFYMYRYDCGGSSGGNYANLGSAEFDTSAVFNMEGFFFTEAA